LSHQDEADKSEFANKLTPERIAQIRERINENFYDREDVLKVVAERILHSPELQELIKSGRLDEII
jgi:DNA polymerase III psi subunit